MIIHDVEQCSDEWFALRVGKPTASEFGKLITSKGEPSKTMAKYAIGLAADLYAGKPLDQWEGNHHTDRGKELEPDARALYEMVHGGDLVQVGFITDDLERYGCSPDSLVNDDGMAEIKCLTKENHIEAMIYYKAKGRCPTKYVQQTQGQLFLAERQWCDLVFFHPELPMLVIRQERDEPLIKSLQNQLALTLVERDKIIELLKEAA